MHVLHIAFATCSEPLIVEFTYGFSLVDEVNFEQGRNCNLTNFYRAKTWMIWEIRLEMGASLH